MVLVTGGTGLVGSHLLYKLLEHNQSVRAIYRSENRLNTVRQVFKYYTKDLEPLFSKIEWVKADITDIPSLAEAFKDVTSVYHCAALISFEPKDYSNLLSVNIDGTANIVNLCVANAVAKLCYVSSIATIGETTSATQLITENTLWNPEQAHSNYAITKYGAEMEVWRGSQEGLDVVIVNPGIILGPGFWGSGSGYLFSRVYKNTNPFSTKGVTGYVDVSDVVTIMVLLMEGVFKNNRYILVTENESFHSVFNKIRIAFNLKPSNKIASKTLLTIAYNIDWLRAFMTKTPRNITKQIANSVLKTSHYDNSKIKNALQYNFLSLDQSIARNAKFFLKDQA